MTSNDSKISNNQAESIGTILSGGKDVKEFIAKGQKWAEKKIAEGWRFTCMGLLSPLDIKESGLQFDNRLEEVWDFKENKMVKKTMGYISIPSQDYINGDTRLGPLGYKYIGPSKQFLDWYMKHRKPEHIDENDSYINKQENINQKEQEIEEWNIDNVTF
jgi:hypothetical protein